MRISGPIRTAIISFAICIVTERFDAGVRGGEPFYFKTRPEPKRLQDLLGHNCINLRLPTHDSLYAWEFERGSRELKVRIVGQLAFNATAQLLKAALAGLGLAYVPEGMVQPYIAKGRLMRLLADWCPPYSGYHLFYPSRSAASSSGRSAGEAVGSWSAPILRAAMTSLATAMAVVALPQPARCPNRNRKPGAR